MRKFKNLPSYCILAIAFWLFINWILEGPKQKEVYFEDESTNEDIDEKINILSKSLLNPNINKEEKNYTRNALNELLSKKEKKNISRSDAYIDDKINNLSKLLLNPNINTEKNNYIRNTITDLLSEKENRNISRDDADKYIEKELDNLKKSLKL